MGIEDPRVSPNTEPTGMQKPAAGDRAAQVIKVVTCHPASLIEQWRQRLSSPLGTGVNTLAVQHTIQHPLIVLGEQTCCLVENKWLWY